MQLKTNEVGEALIKVLNETAESTPKPIDIKQLFANSILDQSKHYPAPQPLVNFIQGDQVYPIRTKKSFSLQQGKQKSKKTTALALEVAAYISPHSSPHKIRFECVEPGVVLFFDNEQGESYAARTMKLILTLAGVEASDRLIYCDLREFTPNERLSIISTGIEVTDNVKWVIIDGIVDVMNDFMSAEEGHFVITDLLKLCSKYDIHVTGVLHQNKGVSKDARAHVGSIASQKCELEIMVERDPKDTSLSIVSAKESRGLHFDDFAIRWPKGELPHIVQDFLHVSGNVSATGTIKSPEPHQVADSVHKELVRKAYLNQPPLMLRSELKPCVQGVVAEATNASCGLNKADVWIAFWLKNGFLLQQGKTGTKTCKFFLPTEMFE